jgi:diguanylate cyclase (GGDEF)-like protein/PAS domain S-box-containing protein
LCSARADHRLLFDDGPVAMLLEVPDGAIQMVNQQFIALSGYTREELIGRTSSEVGFRVDNPLRATLADQLRRTGRANGAEVNLRRKDGTIISSLYTSTTIELEGVTCRLHAVTDISEQKSYQSQLKLASQVFAQSREGVTVTNAHNEIVLVNQAFSAISGYEASDVMGKSPRSFASTRQNDALHTAIWQTIEQHGSWQGETIGRRKNGSEYPEWLAITAIRDDAGEICNFVRTFSDLSDLHSASDRIAWLSHFDPLTQLPNRSLLAERCKHDIDLAQRDQRPIAMMVLGIDRFKHINDSLGNSVGDKLLRKFAARLSGAVREQDTVARVGGDEFVVVLPGEDAQGAALLAERLITRLNRAFEINDSSAVITTSIGIAVFPPDGLDFEALFKSSQVAMHKMKETGRGHYRFFHADMLEVTIQQAVMVSALRNAVARQELQLHYQPFVDLQTGCIAGMEALLRWNNPALGQVSPAVFIPLAEKSNLIVELGNWVLARACRDVRLWQAAGLAVPLVSVNLSPAQFRDPGLLQHIEQTLQEYGVAPDRICLELTEGAVMDDVTRSEQLMRSLKATGLQLSLDDFGTGYSSLSYLKLFPFDKVKIDQSFVRNLLTSAQDAVIAKVVISMAHGLGLRVVAEGVETEAQCEFMRANVCDEIQGYFFSRPVPADAIEALLREDRRLAPHLLRLQRRARTLLLVDDEPNVIASLKRLLRSDGYEILTASSGAEGLELLARQPVDIIVSDQRMPGMTGVQFLRQAKTLYPETMRIVLSGHTELQSVTDAINEGAIYRFLTKPWDDEQLRGFIQDAFHHKELADENERLNLKIRTANHELASSNRQLQEVVDIKQDQLARGQHNLNVMQEALQAIPMPVLALDDEGMIAFVNDQAQQLFANWGPLLTCDIADVLPEIDTLLTCSTSGASAQATIDGKTYKILWRAMQGSSQASGKIITLIEDEHRALS